MKVIRNLDRKALRPVNTAIGSESVARSNPGKNGSPRGECAPAGDRHREGVFEGRFAPRVK
jgi:hypothetical protein